ncbi:MAG: SatD family protein [Candidatus Cloacimonadales bacterium]|nr:SatD family protein [Candidatus Cloacimonadales bacterium]
MIAVVTCDIIKSRQYSNEDRGKVNDLIKTAFNETSELLPESKADKLSFSIIQGDEFQFILENPALAYKFVVFYRIILALKDLKPKFRAGIGIGDVAVDNDTSYKMDGSAFHNSRDAFQKFGKPKFRNRITSIISGNEELDAQFEIIAMYNDFIEQRWTDKQKEAIYWIYQTDTLQEASEKLNIKYQNVDKRIRKAAWYIFLNGLSYWHELIEMRAHPK